MVAGDHCVQHRVVQESDARRLLLSSVGERRQLAHHFLPDHPLPLRLPIPLLHARRLHGEWERGRRGKWEGRLEPRSPLLAIISNRKRIILDQTRNYENVSDWRLFYEVDKDRAVSVIKLRLRCRCLLGYRYCAVFLELEIHYMLM